MVGTNSRHAIDAPAKFRRNSSILHSIPRKLSCKTTNMSPFLHSLGASSTFTEAIGTTAGILTTIAFAPQAVRTWRLGGEELSWAMLTLFGTGVGLWFVYGVLRGSGPIMLANALTGVQVLFIFAVKTWRRGRQRAEQ